MWAREPQRLIVYFVSVRHTDYYYRKYVARNEPMPMAVCIGHHLRFYIGAQSKILGAELGTIGAVLGEPLEFVPSETWGDRFLVPARAEIVIEAEVSPDRKEIEAPFGEYAGYYGGQRLSYVADLKAITRRSDAIFMDIFPSHRDHLIMDGPNMEANILGKLREVVPTVQNVYLPPSGTCRFHAYIQLNKSNDAEPKSIIAAALASDYRIKHVWVVDDDIDIYNEDQVLWAMATRFQGDRDLVVIRDMIGSTLDPSVLEGSKSTKIGFDCTKPASPHHFARKVSVPDLILSRIREAGYITEEDMKRLT
jgi:2,5-furandicarboxylate decarboxylase 1